MTRRTLQENHWKDQKWTDKDDERPTFVPEAVHEKIVTERNKLLELVRRVSEDKNFEMLAEDLVDQIRRKLLEV